MATYNAPVWKNTTKAIASGQSPYTYSIAVQEGASAITVFNGKAWVRPGEGYLYININSIAQNYLTSDLPDLRNVTATTTYVNSLACRQFYLMNSANTVTDTYNFLLDYSYDDIDMTADRVLSEPVNGHGTNGMIFLNTVFSASSLSVRTTLSLSPGSSFDSTHCGEFALYYLNVHGGWDSFLFEGNVTKTDTYKRYQTNASFDNTTLDFQNRTYNNVITGSWKLSSGWLTDAQSEIFARNLLSTSKAYLHDLKANKFYPVNIKDSSATYKTYNNQGKKRVSYQITVDAAQNKVKILK